MATENWPSTIPQVPLSDSYQEQRAPDVIRSSMDVGPAKVRRRSTCGVRQFQVSFDLTKDQADDLDDFYETDLNAGTDWFNWTHPRKQVTAEFRFVNPISYSCVDGIRWIATVTLEEMMSTEEPVV